MSGGTQDQAPNQTIPPQRGNDKSIVERADRLDRLVLVTLDFRLVRDLPFSLEHRPAAHLTPAWHLREDSDRALAQDNADYRTLFEHVARHAEAWLEGQGYVPGSDLIPADRPDIVYQDIDSLFAQVGDWSIVTLLFTERARRLYRYKLPRLTLLYRCVSRMPGSYLGFEHLSTRPPNVVSEAELRPVVRRYTASRGISPPAALKLDRTLASVQPATAMDALASIDTELHGGSDVPQD